MSDTKPFITENITLKGLECWIKREYEHLGCVALCLIEGQTEHAYSYAKTLERLER